VHRGDLVVKLDDRNLRAGLQSVKAQREAERFRLRSEQATLSGVIKHFEFARVTLQRQTALYESGDISRSTLDDAQDSVDDLEARVESSTHAISVIESSIAAADANIDRAEDALTKTVIRAPIDGIITALNAEVGEVVLVGTMNNPGTVIMTIADLSRMILNAEVAETDIARVANAQSARVHINAYQDEIFGGVVRTIALQRTNNPDGTGYFETKIELDLQGRRIYSGLVANVDIEIDEHEGLTVESQAIVERIVDELPRELRDHPLINRRKRITTVAYRLVDGKAVCTPVRTGPSDLTHTLVTEGLSEGDVVVVGPFKVLESIKHEQDLRDEAAPDEDDEKDETDGETTATDEPDEADAPDEDPPE
jgi:HlyD family secretion protein